MLVVGVVVVLWIWSTEIKLTKIENFKLKMCNRQNSLRVIDFYFEIIISCQQYTLEW